jgi:hypothetical protein
VPRARALLDIVGDDRGQRVARLDPEVAVQVVLGPRPGDVEIREVDAEPEPFRAGQMLDDGGGRQRGRRDRRGEGLGVGETVLEATVAALHALQAATPTLVHGDLIAANVLASRNHATAVLDFGFLSTAGDPAFDAAIAASCFDMYGPHATEVEQELDRAFTSAFRHDPERLATFRAAYALSTACCFGNDLSDGHFAWCVTMLGRPDVREAVRA